MPTVHKKQYHVYDDGRSRYWYVWFYDTTGGARRQVKRSTKLPKSEYTREQVQAEYDRLSAGKPARDNRLTIAWLMDYITDRAETEGLSEKSIQNYRAALLHISAVFGPDYRITNIRRTDIWTIQRHMINTGLAQSTVNTYTKTLGIIYGKLLRDGIIEINPFDRHERIKVTKTRPKLIPADGIRRLLKHLESHKNKKAAIMTRLLIFTGLRVGEIREIERADIDLESNTYLTINVKARHRPKLRRTIPTPIRADIEYCLTHNLSGSPSHPCSLYTVSGYDSVAKRIFRAVGLGEYHPHCLRHTFSTAALANGMSVRDLQRYLDHTKITTTDIYTHDHPDIHNTPDITSYSAGFEDENGAENTKKEGE
jgi:integrase/recombinase XerC